MNWPLNSKLNLLLIGIIVGDAGADRYIRGRIVIVTASGECVLFSAKLSGTTKGSLSSLWRWKAFLFIELKK